MPEQESKNAGNINGINWANASERIRLMPRKKACPFHRVHRKEKERNKVLVTLNSKRRFFLLLRN